jgi:hypothetical protein
MRKEHRNLFLSKRLRRSLCFAILSLAEMERHEILTMGFVMNRPPLCRASRTDVLLEASRRDVLEITTTSIAGVLLCFPPSPAVATEQAPPPPSTKKPFASLESLLPAARVNWTIDRAVQVTSQLMVDDDAKSSSSWNELKLLLLSPRNYTTSNLPPLPERPAKEYLDTYDRNRQQLPLLAKPGAMLVQSGEIDTWKRLKRQERRREEEDEIRAALNVYTTSLNYRSDSYLLNVESSERSQMIRQDRLPNIKEVVQSDMGLRYLYRNELLTAMQEVRAELEYQLSQKEENTEPFQMADLLQLLKQSQAACNQWFGLIDEKDVKEAMLVVEDEQKSKP